MALRLVFHFLIVDVLLFSPYGHSLISILLIRHQTRLWAETNMQSKQK